MKLPETTLEKLGYAKSNLFQTLSSPKERNKSQRNNSNLKSNNSPKKRKRNRLNRKNNKSIPSLLNKKRKRTHSINSLNLTSTWMILREISLMLKTKLKHLKDFGAAMTQKDGAYGN
jgi:hypothetical protein